MAALGLGWENVCARLKIRDDGRQREVRAIVLHKPTPKPKFSDQMAKVRNKNIRRQLSVRGREEAADARRNAPITLPTLSILRDQS